MLYLIWGLFNLGLVIYFLVICYRATKLVKEKNGLLTAIFFVFGLFSFIGIHTKDQYNNLNKTSSIVFASADSLNIDASYFIEIDLENNFISKKSLEVNYVREKQDLANIPISAYSTTIGFISGTIWKPNSIEVNRTDDNNKFQYFVTGMVEWKVLGATIFTEVKTFKGIVSIKSEK
jgi:hypothetical protein